jgi:hypothetical protein
LQRMSQTESLWKLTTTDHKEEEQLEHRRNVGENSCNSGDETDQSVQSWIFMMMVMINNNGLFTWKYKRFSTFICRLTWQILALDVVRRRV